MKALKILAAVIASVLVLLAAGALLIAWTFDPNDYKDHVAAWAEARTGRELRIDEDLELSFFPWLAVETGGVTVGNAPGFEALPFATISRVAARVKLLPLLSRQVEIGTIMLDGLELNLARDAEGHGNWEDLLGEAAAPADGETPADPTWLDDLQMEGLRIRNASVSWRENTTELRYVISNARVETGPIALGAPIDVELGLDALDAVSQATARLGGRLTVRYAPGEAAEARDLNLDFAFADGPTPQRGEGRLETRRLVAQDDGVIALGETRLTARATGVSGAPDPLDLTVRLTSLTFDPAAETLRVEDLRTDTAGIPIAWRLEGENVLSAPALAGDLDLGPARAARVLELLDIERPAGVTADALGELRLSTGFAAVLEPRRITLSDMDTRLLGMRLLGNLELDDARASGRLEVPRFTPDEAWRSVAAAYLPAEVDVSAAGPVSLAARFDADLSANRVSLSDVTAALLGTTLSAALEMAPAGSGTRYSGTLSVAPFRGDAVVAALGQALPQPLTAEQLGTLALATRFNYDGGEDRLSLDALQAQALGLRASGRVAGRLLSNAPVWTGEARLEPFAPRDVLARLGEPPPETSDPDVLTRASVEARFEVGSERARFDDLVLVLDDSRITGRFTVEDFDDPAYVFALAVDRLDADRYLPPQAQDAAPGEAVAGEMELPVDVLNALKFRGSVRVGDLRLAGLDVRQISAELTWGDGAARLDAAEAHLYGGDFRGSFGIDGRGQVPGLSLAGRATNIQLADIIEAFTGEANLSGTGSFDLDLTGNGATFIDSVRSASGTASFALREGALEGFNLGRALCQAYNLTQRQPAPPAAERRTRYGLIQGTARVSEGVAHSDDLLARASFMEVTGSGSLTLEQQRMAYDLEATLTGSIDIPNCEPMDSLIGESIPLRLRGPVTEPEISPDYSEILERRVRQELQRRVTDRLQDLIRSR